VVYAQGALFAEWLDAFGESRAKTASVGTLATSMMEASGVFSGIMIAKFGERPCCLVGGLTAACGLLLSSLATQLWHLHLTFGVLVGLGYSLSLFSGVVLMNRWFSSHKALASGIGNVGAGAGTLSFGLLMPGLMAGLGWRAALRFLAAGTLSLCVTAGLLRHPTAADAMHHPIAKEIGARPMVQREPDLEPELHQLPDQRVGLELEPKQGLGQQRQPPVKEEEGSTVVSCGELCANERLRQVMAATTCHAFGIWIPLVYLSKVADDAGFTDAESDSIVNFIGIGSITIRIPMMLLADRFGCNLMASAVLIVFGLVNVTVAVALATSGDRLLLLQSLATLSGACLGTLMSVTSPLAAECVPMAAMAQAVTATYSCLAAGIFLGAPLAGLLFAWTGDMAAAFIFAAIMLFLAAGILNAPRQRGAAYTP